MTNKQAIEKLRKMVPVPDSGITFCSCPLADLVKDSDWTTDDWLRVLTMCWKDAKVAAENASETIAFLEAATGIV